MDNPRQEVKSETTNQTNRINIFPAEGSDLAMTRPLRKVHVTTARGSNSADGVMFASHDRDYETTITARKAAREVALRSRPLNCRRLLLGFLDECFSFLMFSMCGYVQLPLSLPHQLALYFGPNFQTSKRTTCERANKRLMLLFAGLNHISTARLKNAGSAESFRH